MISSIEISRFRGIREGKLEDLTPLVALVGPNGCGKSSILDALLIGGDAGPNPNGAVNRTVQRHRGVNRGARWLIWRAHGGEPAKITVKTCEGDSRTCELRLLHDTSIGCSVSAPKAPVGGKVLELRGVPEICLVEPCLFDIVPPLHNLYTKTVEQGRRNQAKAIVTELVPRAKDLEILTEANTPIVHLVFEDHSVPVALAGDGVYSLVQLSLELASHPHGVILLEEPEVHQHPGAIRQTMRAVLAAVRRDIQVILTTHSLELIDILLAESSDEDLEKLSLYRLQLEDGKLISVRMPGPEVAFSRQKIEDDLR